MYTLENRLDPEHYHTLPGFTIDACVKFTELELDLFTGIEKFLLIEISIRGGISVVCHRYAKANNPLVRDSDHNTITSFRLTSMRIIYGPMSEDLTTRISHFSQKTRLSRSI